MEEEKQRKKRKNRGREKNTKRERPNGGKHLREENPWQEGSKHPGKGKTKNGEQHTVGE